MILILILAKTYHEQIQIKDGSIGNSYEKIFNRFFDENLTQITVQDPYIRAFHQVSSCSFLFVSLNSYLDHQFFTVL
jgi:hypothetical protein